VPISFVRAAEVDDRRGEPACSNSACAARRPITPVDFMTQPLLSIEHVSKTYTRGSERIEVLRDVNLTIDSGEFVGLIGPSGSGKSTLLNLIAALDRPTAGRILMGEEVVSDMDEAAAGRWRSRHVGFVFQFYHLIPVLTAFENVELPLLRFPMSRSRRRAQVHTVLELVGLQHRLHHLPGQMSGGEQQRVGIARALATDPSLIVADEPTGDLDGHTSEEILDLMQTLQAGLRKTIILVTHDPRAASRTQRLVRLEKGVLVAGSENTLAEAFPGWQGSF
jgi:putative ABC transport system ATP-binding protein